MAGVNALKTKLRRVIKARFPGADFSVVYPTGVGRLGGTINWEGFVGQDPTERHRALQAALMEGLTPEERSKLSAIFCVTPYEIAVMDEA